MELKLDIESGCEVADEYFVDASANIVIWRVLEHQADCPLSLRVEID
jgi:hypothetical protein